MRMPQDRSVLRALGEACVEPCTSLADFLTSLHYEYISDIFV